MKKNGEKGLAAKGWSGSTLYQTAAAPGIITSTCLLLIAILSFLSVQTMILQIFFSSYSPALDN